MFWPVLLLALPLVHAVSISRTEDHSHHIKKRLPSTWHLPNDHRVHSLFRRAPGDGTTYAPVGSPTWSSGFPQSTPDASKLPKEWVDALNAVVAAGKIPNIPQSTNTPGVNPTYPQGNNPNGPEVCSATYKCRNPGDIWDAPDGYFATSFDDGPLPDTPTLQRFLEANNETATHFMIGVNILQYPKLFQEAFDSGSDIAAHTWTHPYMTTLSNLEVVAQLGWTSLLIHNSTGGRVPKFWRPPYGDSDNRVRAIAKEVFGLTTVIWNQETLDWSLPTGGTTFTKIHDSFQQWLTGSKSPGLIVLEHENNPMAVQSFMDAYPMIKSNGWKIDSLAALVGGGDTYQNSEDSESSVTPAGILAGQKAASPSPSPSPSASANQTAHSESQANSPTQSAGNLQSTPTPPATSAALSRVDVPRSVFALLGVTVVAAFSVLA